MNDKEKVYVCLYKGPVTVKNLNTLLLWFIHFFICIITFGIVSHTEILINKNSYSSSMMDKGVRDKWINFSDGKWIIYETNADYAIALEQYILAKGMDYDLGGVIAFVLSFIKQAKNKVFCSELSGNMLGLPNKLWPYPTYKNTPEDIRMYCKKAGFRRVTDPVEIKKIIGIN